MLARLGCVSAYAQNVPVTSGPGKWYSFHLLLRFGVFKRLGKELVTNLTGWVFTFGTLRIVSDAEAGKISSQRLFQPSLAHDLAPV